MTHSITATASGARDHARAQTGTRVESQPTVPATDATDLPEGVERTRVIIEETLGPDAYSTHRLPRGARMRLFDATGDACAALMVHRADAPWERMNVADTLKVQWRAYIGAGSAILSGHGRVLATIVEDTSERHDALCGASTASDDDARNGPRPRARDRLLLGLAKHGLTRRDLPATVTLFKGVRISPDGSLRFVGDPAPDRHVTLRAETDLIVTLANCPHRLDPRTSAPVSPLRITAWSGPPTPADDPHRLATPEVLRAFQNTEALLAEEGVR